jgi:iron donor protein CyaY
MSTPDFKTRYDETLQIIEEAVEESMESNETEHDFETISDILSLTYEDGISIIIMCQSATSQLWVDARSGEFHFDLVDGQRIWDSDQEFLATKLSGICRSQDGVDIDFSDKGIA